MSLSASNAAQQSVIVMAQRFLFVAVAAFVFFLHPATADELSLFIGGIEMRLGMPKEPLFTQLSHRYTLTQTPSGTYFIHEKRGNTYDILGGVAFQNGKVSWLSRDWGDFYGENAVDFGKELHSALQSLQEASGQPIALYLSETKNAPGLRTTSIEFLSGKRRLILTISESNKFGKQVSLQEIIK